VNTDLFQQKEKSTDCCLKQCPLPDCCNNHFCASLSQEKLSAYNVVIFLYVQSIELAPIVSSHSTEIYIFGTQLIFPQFSGVGRASTGFFINFHFCHVDLCLEEE
jgi:hypothetical protein